MAVMVLCTMVFSALDASEAEAAVKQANKVKAGGNTAGVYYTWADWKKATQPKQQTWNMIVDQMQKLVESGKAAYAKGDSKEAYKAANSAYFGWYETTGFERVAMGYISGSRKTQMELQFAKVKAAAKKGNAKDEYDKQADLLVSMLREDAHKLDGTTDDSKSKQQGGATDKSGGTSAAAATFLACFGIILREGFEAILIVGAIIAYLVKTAKDDDEAKRKTRPVYLGSIAGVVMSFITAWVLYQVKLANSASQEIIEGVTALIAVCVLYYVSNWMLSKSEAQAWSHYIESMVAKGSEKNSLLALAFTAFLAVYREGAEVILFYQPMLSGDSDTGAVWGGFVIGCICLVFVYIAIRVFSLKVPLKYFFTGTSILMFIMSIAFLGSGIKELIEGDVMTLWAPAWVSWIPSHPVLEIFGIYPCGQTVIAQLILLGITVYIFLRQMKINQEQRAQLIAEHPEILVEEERQKPIKKGDLMDLQEAIPGMIQKAVEEALKNQGK